MNDGATGYIDKTFMKKIEELFSISITLRFECIPIFVISVKILSVGIGINIILVRCFVARVPNAIKLYTYRIQTKIKMCLYRERIALFRNHRESKK